MKIQPINNMNFKSLYVKEFDYNLPQQLAIQNIKDGLDGDSLSEIAAKGYDVFICNSPENKDEVSVSVIKNFNLTDENAVKACRKISIGNYGAEELCSEFNVADIHSKIDDFESNLRKSNNFAKVIIGIMLASAAALWSVMAVKVAKTAVVSDAQKVTTEMVNKTLK